ncbi:MAG: hypothetical protein E7633_09775 [Ruminococcaceae bacterium]|nr:hypothetical protein [Oscillospiraceae bacterium]
MTGKILDEILTAEKKAADIKISANAKAAEMVSDAKIKGEALCREARENSEAKRKNAYSELVRASEEFLEKAKTSAENEAMIVSAAASANIPDAVNFIIGKVGSLWQ